MRHRDLHARPQSARGSAPSWVRRSFWRGPSVWADRRVRARAKARDAGTRKVAGRGLEVAAVENLLAVLLETRGAAHREDVLAHRAPDPVLRIPEGQESRLKAERLALVVEAVLAGQVVKGELHVVKLGPEVCLVSPAHRLARARLVVDDLDLAVADVVDAVDLADDLGAVELQMEAPLERERPQAAHRLHAGDETDVIPEERPNLLLLALAVERSLHARQVAVEVRLQDRFEELPLALAVEISPLLLVFMEVLQHLVQEAAPLHRHRPGLLRQPGMVVVPVEARTLQVVVERGRAEVIDLDDLGIAIRAVGLEGLARVAIGDEAHIEAEARRARRQRIGDGVAVGGDEHLRFASEEHVRRLQPA